MTFDLEKARAVCKTLPKYMNGACPCKEEAEAAKMLIKALPEIRRLQEFRDRVARILKQPLTDCDDLLILGLDARLCQLRRQAARIKELEDALVEERAKTITSQSVTKVIDDDRLEARQQLQAEGKIGPEDAKPRSWQITEERKAAFVWILRRLEYDQSLPGHTYYKIQQAMELLRGMLKEAGQ